jgi:hypothetical protein
MASELVVVRGPEQGRRERLHGDTIVIGRSSACQVILEGAQVSRRHAELRLADGAWTVRDLGAANGTFVNGRRLGANERVSLGPADRLRLGSHIELHLEEAPESAAEPAPAPLPAGPRKAPAWPALIGIGVALGVLAGAAVFLALRYADGTRVISAGSRTTAAATSPSSSSRLSAFVVSTPKSRAGVAVPPTVVLNTIAPPTPSPVAVEATLTVVAPEVVPEEPAKPTVQFSVIENRRLTPCENRGKHNIFIKIVDTAGNPVDGVTLLQVTGGTTGNPLDKTVSGTKGPGLAEFAMWKGGGYDVYVTTDGANPSNSEIARGMTSGLPDEAECGDGGGGNTLFHNSFNVIFRKNF